MSKAGIVTDKLLNTLKTNNMTTKCLKEARYWVQYDKDDTYIQSRMWASRDQDTSIQDIKDAIELARKEQKELKNT